MSLWVSAALVLFALGSSCVLARLKSGRGVVTQNTSQLSKDAAFVGRDLRRMMLITPPR